MLRFVDEAEQFSLVLGILEAGFEIRGPISVLEPVLRDDNGKRKAKIGFVLAL